MPDKKLTDKEIKEAKSLRWLAIQFPRVENPKDNGDRLCNCINLYCTNAAELIERLYAENERLKNHIQEGIDLAKQTPKMIELVKAEAYKECIEKVGEIITEIYNKHIFGSNDLTDEEKDAIINFSDDITEKIRKLIEERTVEDNEPSSM